MAFQSFSGTEYLKIDLANAFGKDKLDWNERISWFDENESRLSDLNKQAEEPAMYYASLQAYQDTINNRPTGYPISLDACCSGLQILSVLIGCRKSASLCGVLDTGHRADAYTILYKKMCDILGNRTKIERADTKRAIMTSLYGSTAVPEEVFGEGEQLECFFNVMETEATGAWRLNEALQTLWDPEALTNNWILPDNFHVKCKVMGQEKESVQFLNKAYEVISYVNKPTKTSKSLGPNIVHSIDGMIVREMGRRCNYNSEQLLNVINALESKSSRDDRTKDKMVMNLWNHYLSSGFLSARILDYLDSDNMALVDATKIIDLIKTMPNNPFNIIMIHDAFRAHANNGNWVRKTYNQILHEIGKSDLLSYVVSQIKGTKVPVNKLGSFGEDILEANYALS